MMAELLGKETGYCKGKGGSMHIADVDRGNLGANGVVGGGHCLSVGAALTTVIKKINRIVVCFFGDGAANEGSFHEALNLASIWKLPVLFICENNQYGMSMSKKRSMNIDDIAVRASSYGIPGKTIDGNDVLLVYEEAKKARDYVIKNGPMLLVCNTYRYLGHS
jgi:pyruvate dehydrogenase E1 component alpha subunit